MRDKSKKKDIRHQVYRQPQQIQDNQHHKNIQHHLGEDDEWLNQTLKLRCQYKEQQQDGYQQDPNHLQDGLLAQEIITTNGCLQFTRPLVAASHKVKHIIHMPLGRTQLYRVKLTFFRSIQMLETRLLPLL